MANQFITPYDWWSVSAAFSRFGGYLYTDMEARYMTPLRANLDMPRMSCECREAQRRRGVWRTEAVADCIRALGYRVECGKYRCINWADAEASGDPRCGGCYRGSNSVIMNIITADGEYVYGNGPDPVSETDGYAIRVAGSSFTRDEEDRDLLGHRSLTELRYERTGDSWGPFPPNSGRAPHHDVTGIMGETDLRDKISQGARCQKGCSRGWTADGQVGGRSTLGNTLPSDIVEALREFQPPIPDAVLYENEFVLPDMNFFQEPDYEFWIPENMMELPNACPVAEAVPVAEVVPVAEAVPIR